MNSAIRAGSIPATFATYTGALSRERSPEELERIVRSRRRRYPLAERRRWAGRILVAR